MTRGPRTPEIARAWLLAALAAACLSGGCEERESAPRRVTPQPSSEAPEAAAARAVASALASVRQGLSVAAPQWELQPLAAGRRLLVRLGEERVEAYGWPGPKLAFESELSGPRAAVTIAGGSVVVVGATASVRIDPGATAPVNLPPLLWLPGMLLLPERRDSSVVFGVQRRQASLLVEPVTTKPGTEHPDTLALADYDGGPITVLRDGTLLYRAEHGLRRALPGGHTHSLSTTLRPWRLLPGRRVDQAWAVGADGTVELFQIGERLRTLEHRSLGAPPFDAAASSDYLAVVVVDEGPGRPRRFRLEVLSNAAELVLERELAPGPPPEGEGWAARAVRDRHVVLGDDVPFVAVGGSGALEVLGLPAGEVLLER